MLQEVIAVNLIGVNYLNIGSATIMLHVDTDTS